MTKSLRLSGMFAAVLVAAFAFVAPANAQATRTWISGVGDDVNPCSRTAPCKTFPGAISKTAAGGEIDTLDPGGFGAITVTKAITLANEGIGEAGILVAGTNGVTVNCATDPNCTVILRGLQIDGGPLPSSNSLAGVRFVAGRTLIIENCTIRNFNGGSPNGYAVAFTPVGSGQQNLLIDHSSFVTNGQSTIAGGGVFVQPTGTPNINVSITNSRISNNVGFGVRVDGTLSTGGTITTTLANNEISGNGTAGVAAISNSGAGVTTVFMNVAQTSVTGNNIGVNGNGSAATVHVGQSVVTGNATGVKVVNSAIVNSYGGNLIADNPIPGPTLPIIGPF